MRVSILLTAVLCTCLGAQSPAPDALAAATGPVASSLTDDPASERLIAAAARMSTGERIAMYQKLTGYKPDNLQYQNLLAAAFIQNMRETADFSYIDRAARIVSHVLSLEPGNYEAMRLRSEIGLERHQFAEVAEWSRDMTGIAAEDAWNWGTLGDALMEMGQYDGAAEAYQKMVTLKPNQSSYNRASY